MTRRSGAWRCVRTFSSISKLSQTCCRESSLIMSLGSSSMTRRPSARAFSKSVRRRRGQRKQDSRGPKSSSCSSRSSILWRLLRSVREKRRELLQDYTWLLHQDNMSAHNALSIRQFLAERNVTVLDYPPYSPDLASCDFFCPPSSRRSLRESAFRICKPSRRL